jgi:hypothetical protein
MTASRHQSERSEDATTTEELIGLYRTAQRTPAGT